MAKKNKEYDPNDTTTWSDEHWDKYIVDQVLSIAKNLPYDKIVLCSIFTYAWWKAYGEGDRPTKGDVMLGVMYGLTIPPALQGGTVANSYAVSLLSALGVGLVKDDLLNKIPIDEVEAVLKVARDTPNIWLDIFDQLKSYVPKALPIEPPTVSDLIS